MDMSSTLDRRHSPRKTLFRTGLPGRRGLPAADTFLEERQDILGLRVAPEHRLREDELAVEVDVEDASRAGHDLERVDLVLHLLENPHRQTGGVRQRASGNAVLDANAVSCCHDPIQSLRAPVPSGRFTAGDNEKAILNNCPQRAGIPCRQPLTSRTTAAYVGRAPSTESPAQQATQVN